MSTIAPMGGKLVTSFVGLQNFIDLFHDDIFFRAAGNTILWGTVGPILEMLTAITLAMIVYFRAPLHRFYRIAWFTPILVSGVIVGLVFRWIFNFDWGILNVGLRAIGLDQLAMNWLGRRDSPIWVVIFVHFWATFGFSFVLMLAGLSAIRWNSLKPPISTAPQAAGYPARFVASLETHRHHRADPVFYGQNARLQCGMGAHQRRADAFFRDRRHLCSKTRVWMEYVRSGLPIGHLRRVVWCHRHWAWPDQPLAEFPGRNMSAGQ